MRRIIGLILVTVLALAACSSTPTAVKEDQDSAARQLDRLNSVQPVPEFSWSQIRQNLIEITMAQAETTQTTSFFFNVGVEMPVSSCPSIGFPIPTTAQLTNPDQAIRVYKGGSEVISQVEQTGIYTGDSTGTYAICVDATGAPYAFYWEGYVGTVSGPAEWRDGRIELIGPPSFEFSNGQ